MCTQALINIFGVPDPSKTAVTRANIKSLTQLCSDFHLSVGVSGRRGDPIKGDYIAAILKRSKVISVVWLALPSCSLSLAS
jgi:hypothetical protein